LTVVLSGGAMMKVSVIIPFYKGLSFLEDCLQSLIEQSYQDIEFIKFKDGQASRKVVNAVFHID
jgi:glycosyltransferase involved in cell wall biosynthesis